MADNRPVVFLNEPRYIMVRCCAECPHFDEVDCDLTENRVYKPYIIPIWCPLPKGESLCQ